MEVERSKLAAVIAGANTNRAILWPELHDCRKARAHGLGDSFYRQPVDDDFEDAANIIIEIRRDRAAQRRAIGIIGRSRHRFIFGADLGARPDDAAGERQNNTFDPVHGLDREFGGAQGGLWRRAHDEEITAADSLFGEPRRRFAEEFTVHDRHAPEVTVSEFLRDLPAIAEVADLIANRQSVRAVEIGKAGRTRRCQHALAKPVDELGLQCITRHGEHEDAHAWAPVWRSAGRPFAIDSGLGAAADDGGGKSGHGGGRLPCPAPAGRGDEDRRAAHRESFRKAVVDADAVFLYWAHATSANASARGRRCSFTANRSRELPK